MDDQSPALDPARLLGALAEHHVDNVLIGGVAVQAYGHVRTTLDLDVIAAWTPENMRCLAGALGELDARLRGVDADLLGIDLTDPRQLLDGGNFLMRTRHGDLDVYAIEQTAGAPSDYRQLRQRGVAIEVLGTRVVIAHPEDLIRMKTAAAGVRDRPDAKRRQDLDDIVVLERARDLQESQRLQRAGTPENPRSSQRGADPPSPSRPRMPQRERDDRDERS